MRASVCWVNWPREEGVPNPVSGTSHLTIVDALRTEVASMPEGAKLDSEIKLAERHQAARETVRRALAVLEADGLIVTEHGRGRFVGSRPTALPPNLEAIAQELAVDLKAGTHSAGGRFLSESELGAERELSRHDARRVLIALEQRGLLVARPGLGRFIV